MLSSKIFFRCLLFGVTVLALENMTLAFIVIEGEFVAIGIALFPIAVGAHFVRDRVFKVVRIVCIRFSKSQCPSIIPMQNDFRPDF
jgi:hypothetical protein